MFRKSPINTAEGPSFLVHRCRVVPAVAVLQGLGLFRVYFAGGCGGSAAVGRKWREEEPWGGSGPSWRSPGDLWGQLLPNPGKGKKKGLYTTVIVFFKIFLSFSPPPSFPPVLTLMLFMFIGSIENITRFERWVLKILWCHFITIGVPLAGHFFTEKLEIQEVRRHWSAGTAALLREGWPSPEGGEEPGPAGCFMSLGHWLTAFYDQILGAFGFFLGHKSIVATQCERLVTFSAYTAKITKLLLTVRPPGCMAAAAWLWFYMGLFLK